LKRDPTTVERGSGGWVVERARGWCWGLGHDRLPTGEVALLRVQHGGKSDGLELYSLRG
jgi:hypothetical protein